MSDDSGNEHVSKNSVPMLTMRNWNTEFKDAFIEHSYRYGKVALILTTETDRYRDIQVVDYDTMVHYELVINSTDVLPGDNMVPTDPNRPLAAGQVRVIRSKRKYKEDKNGREEYREDKKEIEGWTNDKMKIMSNLLRKMERDVKDKILSHPDYDTISRKCDLLGLWRLTRTTALGRGAVSVYQLTLRLINLKQTDSYAKYARDFVAAAQDLQRQGNADEILRKVLNTLFVIGLNQDQFKDKLTPIYGSQDWPDHETLVSDLHTYSEAMRSVEDLKDPERREGKISGYVTETTARGCWNCGLTNHIKKECKRPPSKCENCGQLGHLTRFCLRDREREAPREKKFYTERPSKEENQKKHGTPKKKNHKSERRKKHIKKATAYHSRVKDSEDESSSEDNKMEDYEESSESSQSSIEAYMITSDPRSSKSEKIIIDTACKGAHVLTPKAKGLVSNAQRHLNEVYGIGGTTVRTDVKGQLGDADLGRAVVAPQSDVSLLSLMTLLGKTQGSFDGNATTLNIRDKSGKVMIRAKEDDGFWKCSPEDISTIQCYLNDVIIDSDDEQEQHAALQDATFAPVANHCTAEERQRALQCQELCKLLAHPGHDALMKALDHGNLTGTSLTSQDVRNMLQLFGPCKECLEGKMSAARQPKSSITTPAHAVGECLHADIIPLNGPSLGGHTQLLISVCEKTGYILVNPLKTKSTKDLCEAFDAVISHYRTYGHTVKRIHTDHERNLQKCKVYLGHMGVEYICMPANHHEVLAERSIRTLRDRYRAILATLPYELPSKLEAEAFVACADGMNRTPRKRSGAYTPYQLVQHRRPTIPRYFFGQTGLFHRRRADSPDTRAEWGIFLSHGSGPRSLRAYLPMRTGVYSMMKFVPHPSYPAEWKLPPRIRTVTSSDRVKYSPSQVLFEQKGELLDAPASMLDAPASNLNPPDSTHHVHTRARQHSNVVDNRYERQDQHHQQPTWKDAVADQKGEAEEYPQKGADLQTTPREEITTPSARTSTPPPTPPTQQVTSSPTPNVDSPAPSAIVENVSERPRRRTSNWKDGPARLAGLELQTARSLKRNHHALLANINATTSDTPDNSSIFVYRVSIKQAMQDPQKRDTARQAIHVEIKNMEENKVIKPVKHEEIPLNSRSKIIPVFMFLKEKFKADGSFDKVKARLVANGAHQHVDDVGETFSPTCNPISFFTQISITAHRRALLSSYDIKGAFLLAKITNGKRIFLRIPRNVVEHWTALYPERRKHVEDNGSMLVELQRYMYGLQESPNKFNELLTQHITGLGLTQSTADPSVFFMDTQEGMLILCIHVDDLLLTSPSRKWQQWFESGMRKEFEIVCQYDKLSYLGMSINYDKRQATIHIAQTGFARDLVKRTLGGTPLRKPPPSPATDSLINEEHDGIESDNRKEFLSTVMALMYLARLTRPDILFATTVLATRCARPTQQDINQLNRVVRYVAGTSDIGLTFDGNQPLAPAIYADASHGIHHDGKGHGGIVITYGSAPVLCRSFKLKLVTRSSTESELVALEEASTYAEWLKLLMSELKIAHRPQIPLYQDNKSTIIIATCGGNFKRTKHMLIRHKFVEDQVKRGNISLKYISTKKMPADFLTKPQQGSVFAGHKARLRIETLPEAP